MTTNDDPNYLGEIMASFPLRPYPQLADLDQEKDGAETESLPRFGERRCDLNMPTLAKNHPLVGQSLMGAQVLRLNDPAALA
jgi:hypothetical protein